MQSQRCQAGGGLRERRGCGARSCCLIREKLKFLMKRLHFGEESGREPCRGSGIPEITIEGAATKPDGSTAAGKPLAVPKLHCSSREAFGYKLYIDLIILSFFPK